MKKKIILKNRISEIPVILNRFAELGKKYCFSEEVVDDLKLALEEIVSNIIYYGFDDDGSHDIIINLSLNKSILEVEIEDDGKPFNPLDYDCPEPGQPLEIYEDGGMGILLVRNLVDDLDYRYEQGRNLLAMKKRIQ